MAVADSILANKDLKLEFKPQNKRHQETDIQEKIFLSVVSYQKTSGENSETKIKLP